MAHAEKQSSVGLTKIRDLMHKHGLTVADIEGFIAKRRGRKPAATQAKAAAKAPRAAVHHVAPKYADPKTGATWSGRGLAPLWIRDVKDRSKFLIEAGATTKDAGAKAALAKKAAAKRVVAPKGGEDGSSHEKGWPGGGRSGEGGGVDARPQHLRKKFRHRAGSQPER